MRNSEKQGRSPEFMLTPNLDQKAVPHGSRLLPGLIVRSHRGLVEGSPLLLQCSQSRSSIADLRSGDSHPRCPRPVAPLQEREGFLEVRSGPPARVLPHTPLPEPVQQEDARPGGADEHPPRAFGAAVVGTLGDLSHPGHHPDCGGGEGKGMQEGIVCRRGYFRQVRIQDRVDLRGQGRGHHPPRGRDYSLLLGRGGCRRETHWGCSHPPRWSWRLLGGQGFLLSGLGAALAGRIRSSGGSHPKGQFPQGVVGSGSSLGLWQTPDHRGGYKPAQGSVLSRAPQGKDPWWPAGSLGGQDGGLHLRAVPKRRARTPPAPPGRFAGLKGYASGVLGKPKTVTTRTKASKECKKLRCPKRRLRSLETLPSPYPSQLSGESASGMSEAAPTIRTSGIAY